MSGSLDLSLGAISERPTILVVEDELHIREVLSGLLGALGYRLLLAASAEQALDVVNVVSPDLVLTDVHLGAMSGVELCARLKADPRYELMPVVILTAVGDLEARVAGLAAGADDFFTKPVEFVELRTRLAALLRVKMLLGQLERAEAVITTLALTIEARDPYTLGHCDRLSRYAVALGEALAQETGGIYLDPTRSGKQYRKSLTLSANKVESIELPKECVGQQPADGSVADEEPRRAARA